MLGSGRSIIMPYLAHLLEDNCESFDHLRSTIEDRLPAYEAELSDLFGEDAHSPTEGGKSGFRLYFAGWSERESKPSIFSISNSINGSDSYRAIGAGLGFSAPGLTPADNTLGHGGPVNLAPENMENVALTTLELQRQKRWELSNDFRVGGHVEFTVVRRDHIETKILKRWAEDVIGEKIQPHPVDWARWRFDHAPGAKAAEEMPAGLSKLQQDIWKRKQAKKRRMGM